MPPPGLTAAHSTSNGVSSDSPILAHGAGTGNGNTNDTAATASSPSGPAAKPLNYYEHLAIRYKDHTNARMDAPLEGPECHQFDDYVINLTQQKRKELALHKATNNLSIMQLDWKAPDGEFNLAFMYGDWVHGAKQNNIGRKPPLPACEMVRNFIEIQIKRIEGSDDSTLEACGVNAKYAFVGLLEGKPNDTGDATTKSRTASSSSSSDSTVTAMTAASPGAWPSERAKTAADAAAQSTTEAAATTKDADSAKPAATTKTTTKGEQSSSSATTATPSGPVPGAWPHGTTPSPSPPRSWVEDSSDSSSLASFDILPEDAAYNTAESVHLDADEAARTRFADLVAAVSPSSFRSLKAKSAIYLVRVVGIPNPPDWATRHTNKFNGPHERKATLLGLGGWIVEDADKCKRKERKCFERMGAKGIDMDWTFRAPKCMQGEYLPVWKGEWEPGLEDVYAMVWNLVMRQKFVGLTEGYGFGCRDGKDGGLFGVLKGKNPFKMSGGKGEE
jgi:hypothetical protein